VTSNSGHGTLSTNSRKALKLSHQYKTQDTSGHSTWILQNRGHNVRRCL